MLLLVSASRLCRFENSFAMEVLSDTCRRFLDPDPPAATVAVGIVVAGDVVEVDVVVVVVVVVEESIEMTEHMGQAGG